MGAADLIILAVVILGAGFTLVFGTHLWVAFQAGFNSTIADTGVTSETMTNVNNTFNLFDTLFVFLQIGLMIAIVVSFFYLDSHPVYFFLSIFLLVIALVLGAQFSNMWWKIGQSSQLNSTVATYFSGSDWLVDSMPILILFTGLVGLAVLYGKSGGGGT